MNHLVSTTPKHIDRRLSMYSGLQQSMEFDREMRNAESPAASTMLRVPAENAVCQARMEQKSPA